jgi:hypothetical protein
MIIQGHRVKDLLESLRMRWASIRPIDHLYSSTKQVIEDLRREGRQTLVYTVALDTTTKRYSKMTFEQPMSCNSLPVNHAGFHNAQK